jgi:membrane associated rhomboid family serine protease
MTTPPTGPGADGQPPFPAGRPYPPAGYGTGAQYGPGQQFSGPQYSPTEVCAFHPDRSTAMHCTRCGRPACPECLTPASVGFHCRACVAEGQANQRQARTVTGGRLADRPVVTFSLIAVNVVIFLITALQAHSGVDMSGSSLFRRGVLSPQLVASGEWWRLASSGFLHLSVIHIALNMLSLYFLGVGLERMLGPWRFLAVYLLAMLGGAAAVMLLTDSASASAGASGAIFGLMGGLVVVFKRFRYDMRQLVFVLAINLYLSFQLSGISWQDHLGGLFVGAAVTAAMVYPKASNRRKIELAAGIGVLVLVVAVVLFRDSQITTRCAEMAGDYYCNG